MKIKANGITINYQVDGPDNAPCLVFSNSLAATIAMWDEQASALKNKFRVLRYDQRGHGGTEAPAGPFIRSGSRGQHWRLPRHRNISRSGRHRLRRNGGAR